MKINRNYQQEFFAKKRRLKILKLAGLIGGGVFVFGGIIYILFFARWFDVRTVTINTPPTIPITEIHDAIDHWLNQTTLGIRHRRNSVLFSFEGLKSSLAQAFPRIDTVHVSRKSVHEISIVIIDRKATGIWCVSIQSACFYFDETGKAFAQLVPSEGFLFTAVNDARDRTVELGEEVAPESWRGEILNVKHLSQFGSLPIGSFSIPKGSFDEFNAMTKDGWTIKFSLQTDITQQMRNLLQFLKEKIKPEERAALQYVDLTIPDRIYYK
ncbi:MAG: hypothetical protein A3A33_04460 [Candidatus Yanofskybacteria bacterium RIFCSPLOWO2_01_FULL_49_25]|uniref:POTRA domain-containing protein n=1 Tax=Candidatus Yanofskybacteria bacterium RIFCSPLOWO2_01_FULL_49_25 TaxID=1802701 RepID=A0A1F8GWD2_9BACT|nr:MAG: hypothetical protein A3A33_04460 [Candidatus Yanofskybacteria bacterium RIFCSPLOWO2_01_FULL_49_25]